MNKVLAYMQLLRLPNVFTAMSDIFMGFLIAHGSLFPWSEFVPLLVASSCIYLAGMVLNDWFDIEVDRRERPQRPLPSGRVAARHALLLGLVLLFAGGLAATFVGSTSRNVALILIAAVVAYDGILKQTLLGGAVMGLCRTLNVLLGMSSLPGAIWIPFAQPDVPMAWRLGTMVAVGVGLYIWGVTRLAGSEVTGVSTSQVSITMGFNIGLLLFAYVAHIAGRFGVVYVGEETPYWIKVYLDASIESRTQAFYAGVIIWGAVVLVTNFMVCRAITGEGPVKVQQAVKTCIVALIGLDAAAVAFVNGPLWAGAVLLLLLPTLFLGRWVYST